MNELLKLYHLVPTDFYVYLIGVTGLSAFLVKLKKRLLDPTDKVMHGLNITLSILVALVPAIINGFGTDPVKVYGQRIGAIVGLMTTVYIYVIKPANNFLHDSKTERLQPAVQYEVPAGTSTVTTAPVATGTTTTTPVVDEFAN